MESMESMKIENMNRCGKIIGQCICCGEMITDDDNDDDLENELCYECSDEMALDMAKD